MLSEREPTNRMERAVQHQVIFLGVRRFWKCSAYVNLTNKLFPSGASITRDMRKAEAFSLQNIRSIRPGDGLHFRFFNQIIGRRANSDIEFGTPPRWELIETDQGNEELG